MTVIIDVTLGVAFAVAARVLADGAMRFAQFVRDHYDDARNDA